MAITLEDYYEDILAKAMAGLSLSKTEAASRAGVEERAVNEGLRGTFDESTARKLAPVLNLGVESLLQCGRRTWQPRPVSLDGLFQDNSPSPIPGYEEMRVNAYLVWDTATKKGIAFDAGACGDSLVAAINEHAIDVQVILLTHSHGDHIEGLPTLREACGEAPVFIGEKESAPGATAFSAGKTFKVGPLRVESVETAGRSPGGITYVISGLSKPVAIVGDALFANSMGGAATAWQHALDANTRNILSLPEETILCPGHGPMTTVAEEKANNPFYPQFQ